MKRILKLAIPIFITLLFLYVLDRACKIYDKLAEKKASTSRTEHSCGANQNIEKEYAAATALSLKPYIMFTIEPNFRSRTVNVNSLGFRGPEIAQKKPGTYRIVIVGGSAAFGYGASGDDKIFSKILETSLNMNGPKKFEVINAGLPSAVSMQEFVIISTKIIPLEPDMVLIFDGFNDIVGSVTNDRRPGYPSSYANLEKKLNQSVTQAFIKKRLMNYRPTKKILEYLEKRKLDHNKTRDNFTINLPAVELYKTMLDRMAHLLESYGIKTVFAYQPSLYFKSSLGPREALLLKKESDNRKSTLREMISLGLAAAKEAAQKNDVMFIDCLEVFDEEHGDIFTDTVHFNDRGQEVLAVFLRDSLRSALPKDRSPSQ